MFGVASGWVVSRREMVNLSARNPAARLHPSQPLGKSVYNRLSRPVDPGATEQGAMKPAKSLGDLTERNVELIARMEKASEIHRTFGERLADFVAAWVGRWTFLLVQSALLVVWMLVNVVGWWMRWDPYPFVLLNLVLSFQAAFATPIILMSQNRQARLTDRRNHLDLQINLLAEQ
jgi:uncharacterized membrane protein